MNLLAEENLSVRIFYSSKTEPELLVFYADGISYLKDSDIDVKIIDVAEEPEEARKRDVNSTPFVLVEKNGEKQEEIGVVSYLSGTLEKKNIRNKLENYR